MGFAPDSRSQLLLSLLSWAVVIALYLGNKWFLNRRPETEGALPTAEATRVLVLANATSNSAELLDELRSIGATQTAKYLVVVPGQPDRHRRGGLQRTPRRVERDPGRGAGQTGLHRGDTGFGRIWTSRASAGSSAHFGRSPTP